MEPMKPTKPMKPMKPMEPMKAMKPMEPMKTVTPWWPASLGEPESAGGQNDLQYAYFGKPHRLAVKQGGKTTIYDTADQRIHGVAQQQGGNSHDSPTFTSQKGTVTLHELKVVEA